MKLINRQPSRQLFRQPFSLATRVMVFVGLAIGLSLFLIGNLVLNAVERHFAEQDAGELLVMTEAVVKALHNGGDDPGRLREALSNAISGHHGVYFQVLDPRGGVVYSTPGGDLPQAAKTLTPVTEIYAGNLQNWHTDGMTLRGVLTQNDVMGRSYSIIAAIDLGFHLQFLDSFRRSLWLIMSLAGAITLLAAWYGVHQAHAPLRGLSDRMGDIQADRLHVRLDPSLVPPELRDVVTSFNHMIGRLEDSFTRLSHFSADIAHELRTPLTNLITQTQVGLGKGRTAEEYRELLYSSLEEQERLAKMVNDMLWLAKNDHGQLKPVQIPLNLASEVNELFDFFEALAEERQISLLLEGKAPAIQGDRAMLRRAISNLLSNALRHTPPGENVLVRLAKPSDYDVSLSVQNPGPEIPTEHLANIFERFYRVDPSRTRQSEGAGLGLAIVRSIIEAHGGRVEAASSPAATTFTLWLPVAT
ncbi:MAG: two-component system heavy metal sensor histidine kinase CusS [Porticoccus sp.]|jgi:two-component system heavy metal sensor histidine kinase CusS|uniref:heavy metal sensor histidine kinase n=1 Tax=Porticoccus sp. TaxID=2024853 RepID=UPI0039E56511|tara:strand:+ start:58663 stop:60084 length:1422 start_codon:yes stop_codon:yes gene_type:complete